MALNRQHRTFRERRNVAKRMFAKQNAPCHICQGKLGPIHYDGDEGKVGMPLSFDLDHKVPVSKGGSLLDLNNFAASHARCNRGRQDTDLDEYRAKVNGQQKPSTQFRRTTYWGNMKPPHEGNSIPPFKWY
ncbi:HNH endonuclease [Kocuria kalidii]|uniref:HNH endonuclease n=1 Tax=Kocuria kalidii TaxID=3376283 RepID=UPI003793A990